MAKATAKKATATKTKAPAKAATKAPKTSQVYGIDAMVDAVYEDVRSNDKAPASAKEVTKVAIKAILQSEKALIKSAVSEGDKVQYIGFGGFEQAERSARKGRNPQTGEELEIPASVVPKFKPGKEFKNAIKA